MPEWVADKPVACWITSDIDQRVKMSLEPSISVTLHIITHAAGISTVWNPKSTKQKVKHARVHITVDVFVQEGVTNELCLPNAWCACHHQCVHVVWEVMLHVLFPLRKQLSGSRRVGGEVDVFGFLHHGVSALAQHVPRFTIRSTTTHRSIKVHHVLLHAH